jgi:hypothetical protein
LVLRPGITGMKIRDASTLEARWRSREVRYRRNLDIR